jgi:transposase
MYKWRHLVETYFSKNKEFKRIAFRSDKTDASYEAMIYAAATVIELR